MTQASERVMHAAELHQAMILDAFFLNQILWLERLSTGELTPSSPHPRLRRSVRAAAMRPGRSGVICLPGMEPSSLTDLDEIDQALAWLQANGSRDALIWAPIRRRLLDISLQARGCAESFGPTWMARRLVALVPPAPMAGFDVRPATSEDIDALARTPSIPYLVPEQIVTTRELHLRGTSQGVIWLVAKDNRTVLGQAIVNLSRDMAGLFNVAVHPNHRRRGIGRALTVAAINVATRAGASWMALNSTNDGLRLYRRLGFDYLGTGQTWFLNSRRMQSMPRGEMIRTAEGIARNDPEIMRQQLPSTLPNGDTPMQFAARFRQRAAVLQLLNAGHPAEVMALWDVGLKDEARKAMNSTAERDRPSGPSRATPLHHAVERNDLELARALILAGADLELKDAEHRTTPLGWAQALGRTEMITLLRWHAR